MTLVQGQSGASGDSVSGSSVAGSSVGSRAGTTRPRRPGPGGGQEFDDPGPCSEALRVPLGEVPFPSKMPCVKPIVLTSPGLDFACVTLVNIFTTYTCVFVVDVIDNDNLSLSRLLLRVALSHSIVCIPMFSLYRPKPLLYSPPSTAPTQAVEMNSRTLKHSRLPCSAVIASPRLFGAVEVPSTYQTQWPMMTDL